MVREAYARGGRWRKGWLRGLFLMVLLATSAALAQAPENVLKSIKTVKSGVEIEIHSKRPFLQSDLPMLRIGEQEFTRSRAPEDGDLNTLIFMLTAEDFAKLKDGDRVIFQFGRGEGRNQRDFGRLDKAKKDK